MNLNTIDTIVAPSTPCGRGGISIVRVSGPLTKNIAQQLLGVLPKPRYAHFSPFRNQQNQIIDEGLALYFPTPNSFTGEDILELHGHGSPVVVDALVQAVIFFGARLARPGEFSERAFLNNKIDLTQAEAIADLIDSASQQAACSALRSLQGEFARKVNTMIDTLIKLRMYVEASLDFPEEEIDFLTTGNIEQRTLGLLQQLQEILTCAQQGVLLREGITVVIAGKPNVGKSSLLNRLAGRETAIVTHIPGTTRDVMREYISLNGIPLHVIDTAGLRHSDDPVEQEGIRRAKEEIQKADRLLLMLETNDPENISVAKHLDELDIEENVNIPITVIRNKIDLSQTQPSYSKAHAAPLIQLSVKTGEGIDLLIQHLLESMDHQQEKSEFTARRRHVDALHKAQYSIQQGWDQLNMSRASELFAEELRRAQHALEEITGRFTSDDLLGKIFSAFCIGK